MMEQGRGEYMRDPTWGLRMTTQVTNQWITEQLTGRTHQDRVALLGSELVAFYGGEEGIRTMEEV